MSSSRNRRITYSSLGAVVVLLIIGTTFYKTVEDFTWIDAFYFSVSTLATVGYGDFVPSTTVGKLFTSFYILAGVGILTGYFTLKFERRTKKYEQQTQADSKIQDS